MNTVLEKAKSFIYRNARPIDYARWCYHFENGTAEEVLKALKAYQNEDGGFGHALEADCWNPNSAPMQTWYATEILRELFVTSKNDKVFELIKNSDLIKGILCYLESSLDEEEKGWGNCIESNNNYPHAPWWEYSITSKEQQLLNERFNDIYNPTAALAGFILMYAPKDSDIYQKASCIAERAIEDILIVEETGDMHVISCFVQLLEYIKMTNVSVEFKTYELEQKIKTLVHGTISHNKEQWGKSYLCKPSQYMRSKESIFFEQNREIALFECDFIRKTQMDDGTWSIAWAWGSYLEEWAISQNWWKSDAIIKNCLYLRNVLDEEDKCQ